MRIIDLRRNESVIRCNRCGDFFIINRKNKKYCNFCVKRHTGSKSYRLWKQQVFSKDNYVCQDCGKTDNLQAHHKKRWIDEVDLRYDVNNGKTLCSECHKKYKQRVLIKIDCG